MNQLVIRGVLGSLFAVSIYGQTIVTYPPPQVTVTSGGTNGGLYRNSTGAVVASSTGAAGTQCWVEVDGAAPTWTTCPGGGGTKIFYIPMNVAVCVAGSAGYGVSVPSTNAPQQTCINSGTAVLGILQFASLTTNQSIQFHFQLPPDWTGAVDIMAAIRSTDSTHSSTLNIQTKCVGAAAIDNPTFNSAQALTITAGASSIRTTGTLTGVTTTGCSPDDEMYWKITGDLTNLTSTLDLITLRPVIRRTF